MMKIMNECHIVIVNLFMRKHLISKRLECILHLVLVNIGADFVKGIYLLTLVAVRMKTLCLISAEIERDRH